jgi:hypothetical protein
MEYQQMAISGPLSELTKAVMEKKKSCKSKDLAASNNMPTNQIAIFRKLLTKGIY